MCSLKKTVCVCRLTVFKKKTPVLQVIKDHYTMVMQYNVIRISFLPGLHWCYLNDHANTNNVGILVNKLA